MFDINNNLPVNQPMAIANVGFLLGEAAKLYTVEYEELPQCIGCSAALGLLSKFHNNQIMHYDVRFIITCGVVS